MAVSARNQLTGTVSAVAAGAVNDEVELTFAGGAKLVAIVTHSSKEALGLAAGKEAIALIKAPWVTLATEDCGLKFSARNQFAGSVTPHHRRGGQRDGTHQNRRGLRDHRRRHQ